jgi:hypothetical protein
VNTSALRTLIIYAAIIPLAIYVGWASADMTRTSFAMLSAIVFILLLPFFLKWHYQVMLFSWNTYITIFFLPGKPALWMLMALLNFGIAILNRIIQKRPAFISAPSITISLLAFAAVTLITAYLRGGIGVRAMGGGAAGGKSYFLIFAAIIGYFALASTPIPPNRARRYILLFLLGALVTAGSNLIYLAGEPFYFLFAIFPPDFAAVQAYSEVSGSVSRVAGFGWSATLALYYLLARYGLQGVLTSWWRLLVCVGLIGASAFSGYRSTPVIIGLTLVALFFAERLYRTSLLPKIAAAGVLSMVLLMAFATSLPFSVQRSLSFLPGIRVDPNVRAESRGSIEWRQQMWRALLPDLPKYFWLGKGYSLNLTDQYLAFEAQRRYRVPNYYTALQAGNYHNGPLSVYVPLGSLGLLAFVALLWVSIRALYLNSRYGAEELRTINRLLFAAFVGRSIFFIFGFGAIAVELYIFTGIVGLSVALNRGICRKPAAPLPAPVRLRGGFVTGGAEPRPA